MTDAKSMATHLPVNHQLEAVVDSDEPVDSTLYRAMIGSLMYLTASRPDIMFVVCICSRLQADPHVSHLSAVKRIFRYLKGRPKLGIWYPSEGNLDFVAYFDADYGGCNLTRKSTSGGCQFLGGRIVSWQCKKHTLVANSTCEAEYVAAGNCCSQVSWIQQQLRDYGLNFINIPIMDDNESTISITNNPVKHRKTKHIKIRHHSIRDCAEKRLIHMVKVHSDHNYSDLYTKAFDRSRFDFLLQVNGMRNPE
uniref:secreted RxLR effector protein 161-like n=1 Tax=Erigeron canadensis TaxID=72917 RepID=UPI001CB92473|nr:secreted RxLR effector protein 161-like [Erigeron canadensis]